MSTNSKNFVVNGLTVKGPVATVNGYQVLTTYDVGISNGVASLNASGFIPDSQLNINERIQDIAAQMILNGSHTNVDIIYNDTAGTLSFEASGGGGAADIGLIIALS